MIFFGVEYRRGEGLRCVWILESDKKKLTTYGMSRIRRSVGASAQHAVLNQWVRGGQPSYNFHPSASSGNPRPELSALCGGGSIS